MKYFLHILFLLNVILCSQYAAATESNHSHSETATYPTFPNVHIKTNMGDIYLALDGRRSPITVNNFLRYVEEDRYVGTIFHRVIPGFVAQGGGYLEDYKEIKTHDTIINESGNGLSNLTGTLAMAREDQPHTANSQFYINLVDNQKLDPRPDRWGYAVFGEVQYGMPLLLEISKQPTSAGGIFEKDVPVEPLIIETVRIMHKDEMIPLEPLIFHDDVDEDLEDAVKDAVDNDQQNEIANEHANTAKTTSKNKKEQQQEKKHKHTKSTMDESK